MAWQKQADRIFVCLFCLFAGVRKLLLVVDGDFIWGGEYTVQCTDGALWNCAPVICMI